MFTLSEAEIGQAHRDRWAKAVADVGPEATPHDVPRDVRDAINEAHRQDWVRWVAERDGKDTATVVKHDKTATLKKFMSLAPAGLEVTAAFLAGAADCSEGTAQKFINDNRFLFIAVPGKRGKYTVADADAMRAAAKSPGAVPVVPATAPEPVGAPSVPTSPPDTRIPPP